jgi:hypothetical protein
LNANTTPLSTERPRKSPLQARFREFRKMTSSTG